MLRNAVPDSNGQFNFVSFSMYLSCPPGTYSPTTPTTYCAPCLSGSFAVELGSTSCLLCPDQTLTNVSSGASSIEFCNLCDSEKSCNGHGSCYVDVTSRIVRCQCNGWYHLSDRDDCSTPMVAVILGCIVAFLLTLFATVYFFRFHKHKRLFRVKELELNTLLLDRDSEG